MTDRVSASIEIGSEIAADLFAVLFGFAARHMVLFG